MSGTYQRTFDTAITNGFHNLACGEAISTLDSNLSNEELTAMTEEAAQLPSLLFREVKDWENAKRANLFPKEQINQPLQSLGRLLMSPTSNNWTPHIHRFLNYSKSVIQAAARDVPLPRDIDSLFKWSPNRVGINLMRGKLDQEARIPRHTDPPEEAGLVLALELFGLSAGRMSMIFCDDVCKTLGLEQPEHQVTTITDSISLTLSELR